MVSDPIIEDGSNFARATAQQTPPGDINGENGHPPSNGISHNGSNSVSDADTQRATPSDGTSNHARPFDREEKSRVNARWNEVRGAVKFMKTRSVPGNEPGTAELEMLQAESNFSEKKQPSFSQTKSIASERKKTTKSILKGRKDAPPNAAKTQLPSLYQHGFLGEKHVRFNLAGTGKTRSVFERFLSLPRIRPHSARLVHIWKLVFMVPLAYETWAFPFRLALGSPGSFGIFIGDLVCDAWFILDAVVGCFVADPDEPEILTRRELGWRYLKSVLTGFGIVLTASS